MRNFFKIFICAVIGGIFVFVAVRADKVSVLDSVRAFFVSLPQCASLSAQLSEISLDNESLRQRIERKEEEAVDDKFHYKIGRVYSRYPSNDRSSVVIDIGSEDGVSPGMPAMIRDSVLFGKVRSVSRTQSEIETVFSPRWKNSVGVGERLAKAVLEGSGVPSVGLISKDDSISLGDRVVNLSPDFPLYAYIGSVSSTSSSPNDVWQSAAIEVPYSLQEIDRVNIIVDFP